MKRIVLPALFILAGCGTPQQNCISGATRDMRVVDRLIAQTEGNLQRGYAIEEQVISRTVWVRCQPRLGPGQPAAGPQMCLDDVDEVVRRPQAIDLNAEAAKLASLKAKRTAQAKAASPAINACKTQYPE